jgi:hypothetical protein
LEVISAVAFLLYSLGATAMYGNDFVTATILCFAAVAILVAKVFSEKKVGSHSKSDVIRGLVIFLGALAFGTSIFWIRHRQSLVPMTVLSAKQGVIPTIEIGTSGVIFTKSKKGRFPSENGVFFAKAGSYPLDALEPILRDCDFEIESIAGQIKVSMTIRNANGDVVAEIIRNEWSVAAPPISWDRNYNPDSLEVRDNRGNIILQVTTMPGKVRMQVVFYRKNGNKAYLLQSFVRSDAIMSFNVVPGPGVDDLKIVPPLFKYPSKSHLGELVVAEGR